MAGQALHMLAFSQSMSTLLFFKTREFEERGSP